MKRFVVLSAVVLASLTVAPEATAQGSTGEFTISFTGADPETAETNIPYNSRGVLLEATTFLNEWLGITFEYGYARSGSFFSGLDADRTTYMGGYRVRFVNHSKVTSSVRFLAGGATSRVEGIGVDLFENTFAMAFGGNLDIRLTDHVALRFQPDLLILDFDEISFRFGVGVSFSFGGESAPRRTTAPRPAGAPLPAGAVPVQPPPVAPGRVRIEAGPIPAGTAPPEKVGESARWTSITATGIGYEWSVTVRNNDIVAHTASATATLYDVNGVAIRTSSSELLEVAPDTSIALGGAGEVSREEAARGDYWTITLRWVDRN